ncbi:5-(carboxyamino)imidazole ribonucleotide synthase [Parasphingopyxis lamellibrachiae]|uniref:N5-carboxyaminoimidazole ribonucleotide synthase n=1 Tax=Parasphingopyxis lamellibrachiae TaxID=680125 RepID=A0A3D9FHY1_9SPHN|nr:5-(carboxyamino)imidazole ribonucleotide synthase [Parasphingopyxis lamellibrachiae]RED17258.1 5-(carboxyamino)imidazole ribonucleotide synthase [Parasphingopyxis lamellibrachiae]
MTVTSEPLPPGSTIGIIGGGQLGRMLSVAAAQLGYACHIYAPDEAPCAADVAARHVRGDYADTAALREFAESADIVTYEFENIPAAGLHALAGQVSLRPNAEALELAQDRLSEKDYIVSHGGTPAGYRSVSSLDELRAALDDLGTPSILKTRRFGYDGKGQVRLTADSDPAAAWAEIGEQPSVLESFMNFDKEFSILLARALDGSIRIWDAPDNHHVDGILAQSIAPGTGIIAEQKAAAGKLASTVAEALGYVGVLTLEFFASADGPVFNEMAPRVHNSGHWTIEGAVTSQFENHIRAVCGLPLGDTALTAPRVEMQNLIGAAANDWPRWLKKDRAHLHLYNKGEARPGRKMGHVTQLF